MKFSLEFECEVDTKEVEGTHHVNTKVLMVVPGEPTVIHIADTQFEIASNIVMDVDAAAYTAKLMLEQIKHDLADIIVEKLTDKDIQQHLEIEYLKKEKVLEKEMMCKLE